MAYVAFHDLDPCTPLHCKHIFSLSFACFVWVAQPFEYPPYVWGIPDLPDIASLHKPHSFSSPSFIKGRNDIKCEWLKNWQCLTRRRGDFGGDGWMKETIDEDLSKYLKSRQMKEGCDSRAEAGTWGRRNPGRKREPSGWGRGRGQGNNFKDTLQNDCFLYNSFKNQLS